MLSLPWSLLDLSLTRSICSLFWVSVHIVWFKDIRESVKGDSWLQIHLMVTFAEAGSISTEPYSKEKSTSPSWACCNEFETEWRHLTAACVHLEFRREGWLARDANMDGQCNLHIAPAYHVSGTVLGTWDKSVKKPDKNPHPLWFFGWSDVLCVDITVRFVNLGEVV